VKSNNIIEFNHDRFDFDKMIFFYQYRLDVSVLVKINNGIDSDVINYIAFQKRKLEFNNIRASVPVKEMAPEALYGQYLQ
jgi:hypothetical protein